nr:ATP-binding cassette domain-containing protein [Natronoglycomyces albus]
MPQSIRAIGGLRVREQVAYVAWLKGMSRSRAWEAAAAALAKTDLSDLAERPATRLSGGQRRRMGIAQTIVHGARFIFLDEPTAGLDPLQLERFNCLLAELSADHHFVVSTHDITALTSKYDRVLVVASGATAFAGSAQDFLALAGHGGEGREASAYRVALNGGRP